jgi:hypothetical protein
MLNGRQCAGCPVKRLAAGTLLTLTLGAAAAGAEERAAAAVGAAESPVVPETGTAHTPGEQPVSTATTSAPQPPGDSPSGSAAKVEGATPSTEMSLAEVVALVRLQQQRLEEQQQQLAAQQVTIDAQQQKLDEQQKRLGEQTSSLTAAQRRMEAQDQKIATLTQELDVLTSPATVSGSGAVEAPVPDLKAEPVERTTVAAVDPGESEGIPTEDERAQQTGDAVAQAQQDDPTRALLEEFKGAWRLPGTNAALGIGGFVKTAVVYNFDPLEISDRFIVGSIPVSDVLASEIEAESSITADQSRLNFDLREPTEFGILRAFIEGDFAENNDTFRLRHAFGQWNKITAGKTWSAFVDTQASPEEVDFEGLNGRINVRQSQVRLMPSIGDEYEFQLSLEDPNPQVQNGSGVTRMPDIILTGRLQPRDRLHTKAGLLLRQIRAQRTVAQGAGVEKTHGWGLSISGRYETPRFNERDNLLFQLNYGDVIGRYVNDLSSVGDFDGIFDQDGDLELFDIFSGYISWQHWWDRDFWGLQWLGRNQMRSNFTLGYVEVDNPGFVSGDAYRRTIRLSANLFWSPTPRIDVGGEYLWGNRENEDGADGDAMQVQLAVRYRF